MLLLLWLLFVGFFLIFLGDSFSAEDAAQVQVEQQQAELQKKLQQGKIKQHNVDEALAETEAAVSSTTLTAEMRSARRANNQRQHVFVFLLMTDGEDTVNSSETIECAVADANSTVRHADIECVFKVVAIGKSTDINVCMKVRCVEKFLSLFNFSL